MGTPAQDYLAIARGGLREQIRDPFQDPPRPLPAPVADGPDTPEIRAYTLTNPDARRGIVARDRHQPDNIHVLIGDFEDLRIGDKFRVEYETGSFSADARLELRMIGVVVDVRDHDPFR